MCIHVIVLLFCVSKLMFSLHIYSLTTQTSVWINGSLSMSVVLKIVLATLVMSLWQEGIFSNQYQLKMGLNTNVQLFKKICELCFIPK